MTRVWHWSDFDTWRDPVRELLVDVLTDDVFALFRADPPEYVVGDDLSWLDAIIEQAGGDWIDIKFLLGARLRLRYDAMRAYHAARPLDPALYRRDGLKVLDGAAKLADLGRWLADAGLDVPAEELRRAAADVGLDGREGRLYFEANVGFLTRHCGHYLVYGSEYLNATAARLGEQHRAVLRRLGVPTVFVCDVPLDLIGQGQLDDYAGEALATLFRAELGDVDHGHEHQAAGLVLRQNLPPEAIVDHCHPERVFDPIFQVWREVWTRPNAAATA